MQIACPGCGQTLVIDRTSPQVGCPYCATVIDVSAYAAPVAEVPAAPPAQPAAAPAPPVVAPLDTARAETSSPAALHGRRSRRRAPGAGMAFGLLALLLVAGTGLGFLALMLLPEPEEPTHQRPLAVRAAERWVARELKLPAEAQFARRDYQLQEVSGGVWEVRSHVQVPGRNESLRRRFTAEVKQHANGNWSLQSLVVDGRTVVAGFWRDAPRVASLPKATPSDDVPGTDDAFADDPAGDAAGREMTIGRAVELVAVDIRESAALRDTRVVWLVDGTPSARRWRSDVLQSLDKITGLLRGEREHALEMAVATFAADVHYLLEEPSDDPDALLQAMEQAEEGAEGSERAFAALRQCAEKYGGRTGGYLIFVLVSEERGDDADEADATLAALRSARARLHVIGTEAPFGRESWEVWNAAGRRDKEEFGDPVQLGPESLLPERLNLEFWYRNYSNDAERLPSGFGPYGLARLCAGTDGRYFTCREGAAAITFRPWGDGGGTPFRWDEKARRRYAPQYRSEAEHRQFLNENAAARGLVAAARQPYLELARTLVYDFPVKSEAELKRSLDEAQKAVARLEPKLRAIYDPLEAGARDRQRLEIPRWQAGYDLAMGRVLAVRVRVEGYNAMLALLKNGRNFENPTSTTWSLQHADSIAAGSRYQKMMQDAQKYLQRVIDEHPGTPWAYLAQQELDARMGWEWSER